MHTGCCGQAITVQPVRACAGLPPLPCQAYRSLECVYRCIGLVDGVLVHEILELVAAWTGGWAGGQVVHAAHGGASHRRRGAVLPGGVGSWLQAGRQAAPGASSKRHDAAGACTHTASEINASIWQERLSLMFLNDCSTDGTRRGRASLWWRAQPASLAGRTACRHRPSSAQAVQRYSSRDPGWMEHVPSSRSAWLAGGQPPPGGLVSEHGGSGWHSETVPGVPSNINASCRARTWSNPYFNHADWS